MEILFVDGSLNSTEAFSEMKIFTTIRFIFSTHFTNVSTVVDSNENTSFRFARILSRDKRDKKWVDKNILRLIETKDTRLFIQKFNSSTDHSSLFRRGKDQIERLIGLKEREG